MHVPDIIFLVLAVSAVSAAVRLCLAVMFPIKQ